MTPLIGLARLNEEQMTPTKRASIITDNMLGAILMLIGAMRFIDDEDDEDRGWRLEGSWVNLTAAQKNQLRAAGKVPHSIAWLDRKTGKWHNIQYSQWPTSGAFAMLGNMSDRKKYTPDLWDTDGYVGMVMAGVSAQSQVMLDQSAMSTFSDVFGRYGAYNQRDPAASAVQKLNRAVSGMVGGLVPRILKDVDYMMDARHRKAETAFELYAQHIPIYRRYIGKEYLDSLGYQVELPREPWSRMYLATKGTPAHQALATLLENGLFISSLNLENRTIYQGDAARKMTTSEMQRYQDAYFPRLRNYLIRETPRLTRLPKEEAQNQLRNGISRLKEEVEDLIVR
jgi:hypothetical protein